MVSIFRTSLMVLISFYSFDPSHANIICEDLPEDICAFSISGAGKRCLLETEARFAGGVDFRCRTSEIEVGRMTNYVESDACVHACGVDRRSVGISSDGLLDPDFTAKLCSPECFDNCPNIVDLYFNLAAGEGAFLPDVCAARRANPHRTMVEILSSGLVSDMLTSEEFSGAPSPSPAST
ncbi:PREDICTED: uncharacterized protein LOC104823275 [Tarenaya hassleriana]|uniref:uncharacterized protein LOC104823275 n=1 Tax=Tarenaya hassleriana TaxID=28532 RepID=UPI00053CA660|nr:PREDICTED: uncharacterized protein LOC104823275 [Tarenaya hassleriana]